MLIPGIDTSYTNLDTHSIKQHVSPFRYRTWLALPRGCELYPAAAVAARSPTLAPQAIVSAAFLRPGTTAWLDRSGPRLNTSAYWVDNHTTMRAAQS